MSAINLLKIVKTSHILREAVEDARRMHKECVEMLELAWDVMESKDKEKERLIKEKEDVVDELEIKVRYDVLMYLAGMPSGGNVPLALILIDTSTDLERVADHIWYLSDDALKYPCLDEKKFVNLLLKMKDLSLDMLRKVEVVLGSCDEKTAQNVIDKNKELQKTYLKLIEEVDKSSLNIHQALGVVLTARNLRRVGKKSASIMEYCLKPYPEAGA
ncbi:MAG: PhoU domain-containing protein [Candidatus Altiarchaeota archaeon]